MSTAEQCLGVYLLIHGRDLDIELNREPVFSQTDVDVALALAEADV